MLDELMSSATKAYEMPLMVFIANSLLIILGLIVYSYCMLKGSIKDLKQYKLIKTNENNKIRKIIDFIVYNFQLVTNRIKL